MNCQPIKDMLKKYFFLSVFHDQISVESLTLLLFLYIIEIQKRED